MGNEKTKYRVGGLWFPDPFNFSSSLTNVG